MKINEIFCSIQGEGMYVGTIAFFVRVSGCNMDCVYCDTNHLEHKDVWLEKIKEEMQNCFCRWVVLTGGEPLLYPEYIKQIADIAHSMEKQIYLETNGTLYVNFDDIVDYVDFISMDIKLPSVGKHRSFWDEHKKFANIAKNKQGQFKIVFNKEIEEEIEKINSIVSIIPDWSVILQPVFEKTYNYKKDFLIDIIKRINSNDVRIIPQTHKILNIQ